MTLNQEYKLSRIEEIKSSNAEDLLDELVRFTNDTKLTVRLEAINALSHFSKSPKAKSALLDQLKDPSWDVRCRAIEALSTFTDAESACAISSMLNDADDLVRITAAEALGDMKFNEAVPYLMQALLDKNELVRGYAALSLSQIGGPKLVLIIEKALAREKRNAARLRFYVALYRLGKENYFQLVLNMLKTKSYKVRAATAHMLAEIADQEKAPVIIRQLHQALRRETTRAAKSSMHNALSELNERFGVPEK